MQKDRDSAAKESASQRHGGRGWRGIARGIEAARGEVRGSEKQAKRAFGVGASSAAGTSTSEFSRSSSGGGSGRSSGSFGSFGGGLHLPPVSRVPLHLPLRPAMIRAPLLSWRGRAVWHTPQ